MLDSLFIRLVPPTTLNGAWCGINVTSGNANIGTTTGNTIGAVTGTVLSVFMYAATTVTGGTVVGIFATSVNTVNIQNNTIAAVDSGGNYGNDFGRLYRHRHRGAAGVFTINGNTDRQHYVQIIFEPGYTPR